MSATTVPRVSVILPTYNRSALLPRAIASVLAQSFSDLELIVVDDASSEDIRAVLDQIGDPRLRYVRRDARGGAPAARNTGIQAARGSWLAFQDSDDEWLLDKLRLQFESLESAGPGFGMSICGMLRRLNKGVRVYPSATRGQRTELDPASVAGSIATYVQVWLVRRDVMLEAGGFDESLPLCDDWELLIRLSQQTRIQVLGLPLAVSAQELDSITVINPQWEVRIRQVLEKHFRYLSGFPRQLAQIEYVLGRSLCRSGDLIKARHTLMQSLRRHPLRARPWALLLASLLGARFASALVNRADRRQLP